MAFTVAIVVAGFSWMAYVAYRSELLLREARKGTEEIIRISKAIAGLVYQEEEKTRAVLSRYRTPQ